MMIFSYQRARGNTKHVSVHSEVNMMGFDRIEAVSLTDQFVQKIEAMMDKIVDGYEAQLDKLFADDQYRILRKNP